MVSPQGTAPLFGSCQPWRGRRATYRPAGEPFAPSRYAVEPIPFAQAKAYVTEHHYVCIQTGLAYPDNALSRCYTRIVGSGVQATSEAQAKAVIACLPPETLGPTTPSPSVSLHWAGPAQTFVDNSLCWTLTAEVAYGKEMHGWAFSSAAELNYGWNVVTRRDRTAQCPTGYTAIGRNSKYPDYCIKPSAERCVACGDPMVISSGEKTLAETDYKRIADSPLEFGRTFSTLGYYRPTNWVPDPLRGFGDFWRHTYDRRVFPENSPYLLATAVRADGSEKHFRTDGLELLNQDRSGETLTRILSGGQSTGFLYRSGRGELETYDPAGILLGIQHFSGAKQTLVYSDASTPAGIAPSAGLLIAVKDAFGRSFQFTYNSLGQMNSMTVPDGGIHSFAFDVNEMLQKIGYPDGSARTYSYNEGYVWGEGPRALTGVFDENNVRVITNSYRNPWQGYVDFSAHANGTDRYVRSPAGSDSVNVEDPLGSTRTYKFQTVNGVSKLISQTLPAGAGTGASTRQLAYDAKGNLASEDGFNGTRTCYVNDSGRSLVTTKVEGLSNATSCDSVTPAGSVLPAGSRKITNVWHPDWQLKSKEAEPRKLTINVYNGQPDPTAGNAVSSCAPADALLFDGRPITVLCKKIEQGSTDPDGSQGFSAPADVNVPTRVSTYTYNQYGQVLTAKGPRTDVNDMTTYAYYTDTTADHTLGDLQSVTNPAGHTTQYVKYDKAGRVLRSIGAAGATTDLAYKPRGWVESVTVKPADGGTAQVTTYSYDAAGQLKQVTLPDAVTLQYTYDDAHRLTGITDGAGNTVTYTLDNAGNRAGETLKDAGGTLARNITRVFDALGRVQQVTGAGQ
ncbi:MAG: RHS repeat protein [Burkholderiales bacterium]|nr:RHS repeat protein [Burkholderiales bacterium]